MTYNYYGIITMKKPTMLGPGIHYIDVVGPFDVNKAYITFQGKIKKYASGSNKYDHIFSVKIRISDIQNIRFTEME